MDFSSVRVILRFDLVTADAKAYGGALLVLKFQLHKRRLRNQIEPVPLDITPGDGDGLDRLVDCLRADSLNLDFAFVPQKGGDGPGDGVGAGVSRYT